MQSNVGQQQYTIQQPQVCIPAVQQAPVQQNVYQTPPQTVQVPNYSGVNIQIFNPSVGVPGGAPVYNVNAPQYQAPNCYPPGYYTNQWGTPDNTNINNNNTVLYPNNNDGINNSVINNGMPQQGLQNGIAVDTSNGTNNLNTTTNTNNNTTTEEKKKTEKRDIIILTDEYIKNLENYLNSQDKEIRLMGAKEVAARLQEDDSRKDDKALTALINKMLQDPYQPVKLLALAMLDSRAVTGDDYTVGVLQQMQNSQTGYGQDALQASQILLKMSGQTAKKEFEVKEKPKTVVKETNKE